MGLLASFREQRRRQGLAERYVAALLEAPRSEHIDHLLSCGASSTEEVLLELAFARRAIGLIVAERDALDDRTAADISHAIDAVVVRESKNRKGQAADWMVHWQQYSLALAERGKSETSLHKIARVLLQRCGVAEPSPEQLEYGLEIVAEYRRAANELLRSTYGSASLPDDQRPSVVHGNTNPALQYGHKSRS